MATMDSRTLVDHTNPDESLAGEDFVVIEKNVAVSENSSPIREPDNTVSQWTIQQSIVLDGNMSLTLSGEKSPSPEPKEVAREANEDETPVLAGSVIRTFPEMTLTNGEMTLESWDSNTSLEGMYAAQAETKQLLTQSIIRIDEMSKELTRMQNLEEEIVQLKTALADKDARILALENAATAVNDAATGKDGSLIKELYNQGLAVDLKEHSLNSLRSELEAANRKIADFTESTKYLNDQLDEMCAKYINEKELTRVLQEQLDSSQQGPGQDKNTHQPLRRRRSGISSPMVDERGMVEQLRLKIEENEKLAKSVKNLDEEVKNSTEIIKVLREDHLEGNRLIAEKEHKISELQKMVESMDQRLQLDSS